MLLLSEKLLSVPVMSLQTGGQIARSSGFIIDPRSLKIVALYVHGPQIEDLTTVLHTDDIREAGELGFIIDDSSKLMGLDGLVRLQQIIDFHFDLMKCFVYEKSGKKIGRVTNFSFDPGSYTVQQLYIKESLLKSLTSTSNIVRRSQIISIDNQKIIVDSPTVTAHDEQVSEAASAFVNPFRQVTPQADQTNI